MKMARPTAAIVDLGACARNFRRLRAHVDNRHVWAVVKADAYGHGAVPVARKLAAEGCHGFAVATVQEGVELRQAGISQPILITAGIEPLAVPRSGAGGVTSGDSNDPILRSWVVSRVAGHDLSIAIWNEETARAIARAARQLDLRPIRVHLKIDTGMGRLGVLPERAPATAAMLDSATGIELEGVFSNLAAADQDPDEAGHRHTAVQISRFAAVCAALQEAGHLPPHRHLANTASLMHHPNSWEAEWCNGVMPGLSIYGASLTPKREPLGLDPALSWWTAVIAVHGVPAGWPVGYGLRHITERPSRIAILPVGYHDGWPRALSERARVLVAGRRAAVVGAVSMDLTMVDVTDLPATRVGDPVALIGSWGDSNMRAFLRGIRGDTKDAPHSVSTVPQEPGAYLHTDPVGDATDEPITAEEVASWADSIGHEILCRIGARVPRLHVDHSGIDLKGASAPADLAEPAS
jgi:alanine racemase